MRARSALGVALLLTSACASVDPQPSFEPVADQVRDRSGIQPSWARTSDDEDAAEKLAAELLAEPLDGYRAAQVALLRNRNLLAEIEELGIAQADYAQATRLANPTFSVSRRTPSIGSGTNVEIELAEDILDVLVQPVRKRLAAVELEAAKLRLGQTMLDLVAEVRTHFFDLVAAEEAVDRLVRVRDLTAAAAELSRRQRAAGNLEELAVAMLEATEAKATIDLTRARLAEGSARERLNVLLGLSGAGTDWTAARRLPPLPAAEPRLTALETQAIENRLDLGAARFGVELVGRALALKRGTRYLPIGVEVGLNSERELDGIRLRGPRIAISLPIFDTGAASIARLEAEHRRAQRQLEQLAIEIRSDVRLTRDEVLGARSLVETYQQVLLPKRDVVLDQTLLHYNMMLLGVYDVLFARREQTEAELEAISALRDYWVAKVRLERAVGRRFDEDAPAPASTTEEPQPAAEEHQHHPNLSGGDR